MTRKSLGRSLISNFRHPKQHTKAQQEGRRQSDQQLIKSNERLPHQRHYRWSVSCSVSKVAPLASADDDEEEEDGLVTVPEDGEKEAASNSTPKSIQRLGSVDAGLSSSTGNCASATRVFDKVLVTYLTWQLSELDG